MNDDDGDFTVYGETDDLDDGDDDGDFTVYGETDDLDDGDDDGDFTVYGETDDLDDEGAGADAEDDIDVDDFLYGEDEDGVDDPEQLDVGLAEYVVADSNDTISTSGLGSCIGLALHDPQAGVYGLVHSMLPKANGSDDEDFVAAKFVDTGLAAMIDEMEGLGARTDRMVARLAGGASMVNFSDETDGIGGRNVRTAKTELADYGITIAGSDTGGDAGRSVVYEPETETLRVSVANEETHRL
jgi:chemotaxis protein CheD